MTEMYKTDEQQKEQSLKQIDKHIDRITKLQQLLEAEEERLFQLIKDEIKRVGKVPDLINLSDFDQPYNITNML